MMYYSTQCFDDAQFTQLDLMMHISDDAHAHRKIKNAHNFTCTHMLAINAHDKFPHLVRWQRNDPATVISRIPRAAINHPEK